MSLWGTFSIKPPHFVWFKVINPNTELNRRNMYLPTHSLHSPGTLDDVQESAAGTLSESGDQMWERTVKGSDRWLQQGLRKDFSGSQGMGRTDKHPRFIWIQLGSSPRNHGAIRGFGHSSSLSSLAPKCYFPWLLWGLSEGVQVQYLTEIQSQGI